MDTSFVGNPLEALRRAGYFPFRDPKTGEHSFVCRLGPDFYPRFHLYLKETAEHVTFSLHLDQKQASYGGAEHQHNGEYSGDHITQEMERIRGWVLHIQQERMALGAKTSSTDDDIQKPWWQFWK